jgi:hypothetical protein
MLNALTHQKYRWKSGMPSFCDVLSSMTEQPTLLRCSFKTAKTKSTGYFRPFANFILGGCNSGITIAADFSPGFHTPGTWMDETIN